MTAPRDVLARFVLQATLRPAAPAVICDERTVTYGELLRRSQAISASLRRRGIGPESVVALRMDRTDALVAAMLGVLHCGAAYLPLDLSVPLERACYMLESSAASVLLTDAGRAGELCTKDVSTIEIGRDASAEGEAVANDRVHPDQLAYVQYTSGSTGRPKGVQIGRGAFYNAVANFESILGAGPDDVFVSVTGISFDIFELELMLPMCAGGVLVLADRARLLEPGYLAGLALRHRATLFQTTPTLARNLLDSGWSPDPGLRILVGGEALPPELAARLHGASGVFNVYGPTEATIWVSSDPVEGTRPPVIGTPLAHTTLHVLDAQLSEVPPEGTGELYIGGLQLARGYAARADLTADRFIPSPFGGGQRLYRTGDLVKRNGDGTLDYLGRSDGQVKLRGHRIELGEVDAVLASHPGVASAVTVVREDNPGEPMLVTYYTTQDQWLDQASDASLSAARTAAWEDIYDGRYAEEGDDAGNGDRSVWIDSRSGESYSPEQMKEWIDTTVERVAQFGARRILEIGCGSGQLLLRLAGGVERYVGTDVSAQALQALRRKTAGMPQVHLRHAPADRTREVAPESFDLVVINSVAQYFPSSAYLLDVLVQAKEVLAPGGVVFVGDLRSLGLLDAFHAAVEMGRSRRPLSASELAQRVGERRKLDNELCLAPQYFAMVKQRVGFGTLQVLSRRGESDTEMNAFRFDAVLRDADPSPAVVRCVQWRSGLWNALHFDELLASAAGGALRVRGIPDARTAGVLNALRSGTRAARPAGLHPEHLIRLAQQRGVQVVAGAPGADGVFDMLLLPSGSRLSDFDLLPSGGPCSELASRPLLGELVRRLEAEALAQAAQRLPGYMVPGVLVHLERFPVNTSGKLDPDALPRPALASATDAQLHDDAEAAIASVFAEVLGLQIPPGAHADFFRLGGHSLAAVRLAARLRERFGPLFDLHAVFALRTVEALAARLREAGARSEVGAAEAPLGDYAPGMRVPLTRAQRSLWFLDRLDGASAIYNMPLAVRIRGDLDITMLRQSIRAVVMRHHALRTVCLDRGGEPEACLQDGAAFDLHVEEGSPDLESRLLEAARRPFDLARDVMLRAHLFRVGPATHVLLLVVHHIAADGLSMMVLCREIERLYAGEVLPPPTAQYADFASWQLRAVGDAQLEAQLAWWRWHLQDAPLALELPLDHVRPPVSEHRGGCVPLVLAPALRARVEALASAHKVSAYTVQLCAFGFLLGRLANQREVLVGVPAGGRQLRQFEQTVGLFVNVLPLRIDALTTGGVGESLRATSALLKEALARQDVAFDQLVEHLGVPRSLDRMPLVQAVFTYLDAAEGLELPGVQSERVPLHQGTSRFDLGLQLAVSREGGWCGIVEFDAGLFETATVAHWASHFEQLLCAMCDAGTTAVADIPLASPRDFARAPCPAEIEDVVSRFEAHREKTPDALALVCGDVRLSFAQLGALADRIALALVEGGVHPGEAVGLHLERNADLIAAIWGVLKAGAAFLPLDTSLPEERLNYMISQSRARRVISDSMPVGPHRPWSVVRPADLLAKRCERGFAAVPVPAATLAYIIFTSGSTGLPKGVEVSRGALAAFTQGWSSFLRIRSGDVGLSLSSIAFDMLIGEVPPLLCAGGAVVLADRRQVLDAGYIGRLIADECVSYLLATPSMLSAWCLGGWKPAPGMRVCTGGEAIAPELAQRLAGQCEFWNTYGPTEVTCGQTAGRMRAPFGVRSSIGTAFGRNELFVLDKRLNPVPPGVLGELYIAGDQLAQGYAGRADLTADRFVPSPFHDGERLYRTGDVVRWRADGEIEHWGRGDDQVKIRGYRMELGEIDNRLLACEGIAAGAVAVRDDSLGDKCLVAYVVPHAGQSVDVRSIEKQLGAHLPAYMVPSHFVVLARLPVTRNGKLDKNALPAPEWVAETMHTETVTSVSSLEGRLAGLMGQVLGSRRSIAADTHFFHAGGHSLAAVRLIADVRREFGVDITLRSFFEDPTPAGLAHRVRSAAGQDAQRSPFVELARGAHGPAIFLVHGADGYAINFRHLGQELAPHARLYGIDGAHAWLPGAAALGVPDLARLYADRLVQDFPQLSEFHIGGWSFGGLVALEMARYLSERGVRVASAFAIDSAIHGAAEDVLGANARIQDLAHRNLLQAGHTEAEVARLLDTPQAVGDLYVALDSNVAAAASYEPAEYDGDFTLIVASEGLAGDEASLEHWRGIVRGELSMPQVQGGHLSILRQPAVAALAREILQCVSAGEFVEQ